ncbi:MAG: glutamate--tRNA ligase [Thaumarchaeota archaeon]|nr:glutamate--tRNA ligase [Nitrososphaerota archaeon]
MAMISEDEQLAKLARKYGYLNAIEHNGKGNLNSVLGKILAEKPDLKSQADGVKTLATQELLAINRLSPDQQKTRFENEFPGELERQIAKKKELSKEASEKKQTLPPLVDAEQGKVVTRFPPEPNGYMHIGHAKAAILGSEYAKMYKGKFLVRFDDTNPAAEKKEYYEAFLESFSWLGIGYDLVRNASDDMLKFYDLAGKMISSSKAYVCDCSQIVMREKRARGELCEHRAQSLSTNLSLWQDMVSGKLTTSTLRFVGDLNSLNTTMRDPVLFRIVEEPHPLKGNSFFVWPTYDFDGPVEDSLDGVTHATRSKEYELRDELYYAILDALDLRKPRIIEFSRLQLQDTTVSKRSLKKLIEEGKVMGWDDPRLPTIAGLKRRGFLPEAIKEFVLSMGLSKVESQPTWDLLESINRKLIDPIAGRYFFVEDPVTVDVENAPNITVTMRLHPDFDFGTKAIETKGKFLISKNDAARVHEGSKFRLIEAYNVSVISKEETLIRARYLPNESTEKTEKLQWVTSEQSIPFEVMVTGPLLINEQYNPESLRLANGRIEWAATNLKPGQIFQLVRFGFCRLDSPGIAIMAHK